MWGASGISFGASIFIHYVNDMVRACPELALVLFADDTSNFAKGKSPAELFQKVNTGLNSLSKWFKYNKLTLNLKKTRVYDAISANTEFDVSPGV